MTVTAPKKYSSIVLLDDLLRDQSLSARRFIYGALSEPVLQSTGLLMPLAERYPGNRGLHKDFCPEDFRRYIIKDKWYECYHTIPDAAANYLLGSIPQGALVLGYEMPPWLISVLKRASIDWIDFRISPLRFARDLYFDITSSIASEGMSRFLVSDEEVRIEAALVKASILQSEYGTGLTERLSDAVIVLGQSKLDASKVSEHAEIVCWEDFCDRFRDVVLDKPVFFKPHPHERRTSAVEIRALNRMLGRSVKRVKTNIYDLLSLGVDAEFLSISSGVHEEARFFDRVSHRMLDPWIYSGRADAGSTVMRVPFSSVLSRDFWSQLILGEASEPYRHIQPNHFRSLHGGWWGYSEYMIDHDRFWRQMIFRAVGIEVGYQLKRRLKI